MYYINGKVSQNQFTFQLCIYINYFSKTSFYFKMVAVNVNENIFTNYNNLMIKK